MYVGVPQPTAAVFALLDPTPDHLVPLDDHLAWRVDGVRDVYAAPELERDYLLDGAATSADPSTQPTGTSTLHVLSCRASTVEDCVADLLWSTRDRPRLLDEDATLLGVHARASDEGVAARVLLGRSEPVAPPP